MAFPAVLDATRDLELADYDRDGDLDTNGLRVQWLQPGRVRIGALATQRERGLPLRAILEPETRMKFAIIAVGCLVLTPSVTAQTVEAWSTPIDQSVWSDSLTRGAVDPLGNTTIVGSRQTSSGGLGVPVAASATIARLDPQGAVIWYRNLDLIPGGVTTFNAVVLDAQGGAIVCGDVRNTIGTPVADVVVARYDANGNIVWSAQYGGGSEDQSYGLAVDSAGDIWIAGQAASDMLVLHYTSSGALVHATTWNGASNFTDQGYRITPDGQGGAYAVGLANGTGPSGPVGQIALVRVDGAGNVLWASEVGMPYSYGYDVVLDSSGGVYVAAALRTTAGLHFGLLKFDANGAVIWQRTARDGQHPAGLARRVAVDPRGDIVVAGTWYGQAPAATLVRKYDSAGDMLWSYSGTGAAQSFGALAVDAGGEVYVAGGVDSGGSSYDETAFCLGRDGDLRWSRSWGNLGHSDFASVIGTGPLGSVFVAGTEMLGDLDIRVVRIDESAVPFCFGDGSSAACPCGNSSLATEREGCLNTLGVGGRLTAPGAASLAADTLVLNSSGMPNVSALYFQGAGPLAGGAGAVFGDGLLCAASPTVRLGTRTNVAGASQYPQAGDPTVSVRGHVLAPGERVYQVWYRNAAPFCTPSTFNLSNGVRVTWAL